MTVELCAHAHRIGRALGDTRCELACAYIALCADETGDTVLTWHELQTGAMMSAASLSESLKQLEAGGWVTRTPWKRGQRNKQSTKFRLTDAFMRGAVAVSEETETATADELVAVDEEELDLPYGVVGDGLDTASFQGLIRQARAERFHGPAADRLAQVVMQEVPGRVGWIARRLSGYDENITEDELVSRSWEVITTRTDLVVESSSPWGVIANVIRAQIRAEAEKTGVGVMELLFDSAALKVEYEHGHGSVSVTDMQEQEESPATDALVEVLRNAGVPHGLAVNGTRRILEIAANEWVRGRVKAVRNDSELAALGITPRAAGAWLGLVAGKHGGGRGQTPFLLRAAQGNPVLDEDDKRRVQTIVQELATKKRGDQI